jgi:hypothetical protein
VQTRDEKQKTHSGRKINRNVISNRSPCSIVISLLFLLMSFLPVPIYFLCSSFFHSCFVPSLSCSLSLSFHIPSSVFLLSFYLHSFLPLFVFIPPSFILYISLYSICPFFLSFSSLSSIHPSFSISHTDSSFIRSFSRPSVFFSFLPNLHPIFLITW